MKIYIAPLGLIFAAIFYSCQKENNEIDIKTDDHSITDAPRIKKIIIANLPFYEYSYTSADIVREEKSTYNLINYKYNALAQLITADYYSANALLNEEQKVLENALNGKGLLDTADSEKDAVLEYKYDINGKLKNTVFSQSSGSNHEYSEFTYDTKDQLARQTLLWDNKIAGYIDYLYDNRGNLIMETVYSITSVGLPELSTTTKNEFDNYKNPFKSFYRLIIPGINTNNNNIVKETFTIHFKPDQGTDIVQITLTSYNYNNRGYPVRKDGNIEYLYE